MFSDRSKYIMMWSVLLSAFFPLYLTYRYEYGYSLSPNSPPVNQGFVLLLKPMTYVLFPWFLSLLNATYSVPYFGGLLPPEVSLGQRLFSLFMNYFLPLIINGLVLTT